MFTFVSVLIIIVSLLLTLVVLVQNSKGGGLAANFSSSSQVMGVRKTADFLEKATWTLAGVLVVLCLMGTMFMPKQGVEQRKSYIKEQINNAVDPSAVPNFPSANQNNTNTPAPDSTK